MDESWSYINRITYKILLVQHEEKEEEKKQTKLAREHRDVRDGIASHLPKKIHNKFMAGFEITARHGGCREN